MTRSERRLLVDTAILGVLLTLLIVALEYTGLLAAPERFFYDLRARNCQYFTPPPTDKLVHLDIDDASLEAIGRWPWSRGTLAEIVDEIRIAGARALAWDVIFSEQQPKGYEEISPLEADLSVRPQTTQPSTQPSASPFVAARRIDDDAAFAMALEDFGRSVVPISLTLSVQSVAQPRSPVYLAMLEALVEDVQLRQKELVGVLKKRGVYDEDLGARVNAFYGRVRREAMYQRIEREMLAGNLSFEQVRDRVLKGLAENVVGSTDLRLLRDEYDRYQNVRTLRRFARSIDEGLPPLISTRDEQAPLRIFGQAAHASGFVDYVPMGDGIVRNVPLWADHRNSAFPQMGLALACAMLDVDTNKLILEKDRVVIPCPDGRRINIPVHMQKTPLGEYGMFFDIPWFGRSGANAWESMYDYPLYREPKKRVSMAFVYEACAVRHRIAKNNSAIDEAIAFLLSYQDESRGAAYLANRPALPDFAVRRPKALKLLEEGRSDLNFLNRADPSGFSEKELIYYRKLKATVPQLEGLLDENAKQVKDLERRQSEIRANLGGRAVLVGYIAVGALADFVPTSLHPRCPGVVVHGVIFNSIMTGRFWHAVPEWVTLAITVLLGLIATAIVSNLPAWKALALSATLVAGYVIFNGVYLFDKHNLIVGVAAPLFAVVAVWAGGTLVRYILEASERARVTSRFRNYVDPELVDAVLASDVRLDGQEKELTVVFTDLAGFTSISERLKEKTVPLLNQYMGEMVPVIRRHRGLLNKFLGDGIMYFFGAPRDNPSHAIDAVASALEMQEVMRSFNRSLVERNLPELSLRVGISSGLMVVGDAGPSDRSASDYTVLGDAVNLGSRLEGANKFFGTRVMVNSRVFDLAGSHFLFRPIGKIQVKGKVQGVMTYEALAAAEKAGDEQKKLAEMTAAMVTLFMAGRFADCVGAIGRLEAAFGRSTLSTLYRGFCEQYLLQPPAGFDGQIVLTEK